MASNPNGLPGVTTTVETLSRGSSVPGGTRIAAFIGEGSKNEVLVSAANGGGQDGFDPTYNSASGADGRHFTLSLFPIVSNRTQLFRNGVPLTGLESLIDEDSFSNKYDYRIDITTGHIELQSAHLVDQGGSFYTTSTTNVGIGKLNGLVLEDVNAPSETWSIKCVSVQRTAMNAPIAGTAKFIAVGSVSGNKLDANGNPIVWVANDTTTTNDILSFSIQEVGTAFREGDVFIVKVSSGVLNKNDTLTATYIAVSTINDPELLQNKDDVIRKHGPTSLDNNLSLACQLAFANQAPAIMCLQAAPAMPRRVSYQITSDFQALSEDPDDFIFPFPLGVTPALESNIHFFVKNNTTNVERQVLPNKYDYYLLDDSSNPTLNNFIFDDTQAPSGNSFSYSVIEAAEALVAGFDGYISENNTVGGGLYAKFSAPTTFDSDYVGKTLKIIDTDNVANKGSFTIDSVSGGDLYFHADSFADFTNETSVTFEVIDPTTDTVVSGATGTDGNLVRNVGLYTASLTSAAFNFGSVDTILNKQLRIGGSDDNNGLYSITAYNSGTDTITIKKRFVGEANLRYEVIDPNDLSKYLVVNHNVVQNGFSLRVTVIDEKDADFYDAGWIDALEVLETQEIDMLAVFPKQTLSVIFQGALAHCRTMSNPRNKKERVFFMGAINGLLPAHLTGAKDAAVEDIGILEGIQGENITDVLEGNIEDLTNYSIADGFGNTYRCVYCYPDQIVCQVGTDNILIDGFYLAAAAAGWHSGQNNIAMPFTKKILTGFTILRNKQFSPLVLEQLTAAGACVLQPVQGGGEVVWGLTTSQSGYAEEQEISIVFIRDRIAKSLRSGFRDFVGLPEDLMIQAKLAARANAILTSFIGQGLITDYKDLNITRDSVDPTAWNITVRVQPTYPINFIKITVSVGLL